MLALEEEHAGAERARASLVEAQNRCAELESLLSERDADLTHLRDVLHSTRITPEFTNHCSTVQRASACAQEEGELKRELEHAHTELETSRKLLAAGSMASGAGGGVGVVPASSAVGGLGVGESVGVGVSTLQAMLESKDSKIITLEGEIRLLEEELARLRETPTPGPGLGLTGGPGSSSSGIEDYDKIIQHLRTNERILRARVRSRRSNR